MRESSGCQQLRGCRVTDSVPRDVTCASAEYCRGGQRGRRGEGSMRRALSRGTSQGAPQGEAKLHDSKGGCERECEMRECVEGLEAQSSLEGLHASQTGLPREPPCMLHKQHALPAASLLAGAAQQAGRSPGLPAAGWSASRKAAMTVQERITQTPQQGVVPGHRGGLAVRTQTMHGHTCLAADSSRRASPRTRLASAWPRTRLASAWPRTRLVLVLDRCACPRSGASR